MMLDKELQELLEKQKRLALEALDQVRQQVESGTLSSLFILGEVLGGNVMVTSTPLINVLAVTGAGISTLVALAQGMTSVHAVGLNKGKEKIN